MKSDARILDDMARVAGGAVNILSGLREQINDDIRERVEMMASRLDLVPREDFEDALAQISALQKRVEALEKNVKRPSKTKSGPDRKTTATKKASAKTAKKPKTAK